MTKRLLSILLALCMALTLLPATALAAGDTCQVKLDGTYDYDGAYEVFDLLNSYRQANGLSPLVMNRDVLEIAMQRAAEVAVYYSHTRPNGNQWHSINSLLMRSENISGGEELAAEAMAGWKDSPGHNANMLTADHRAVGIGVFIADGGERYWVQVFSGYTTLADEPRTSGKRAVTAEIEALPSFLDIYASPRSVSLHTGETAALAAQLGNRTTSPIVYITSAQSQSPDIAAVSVGRDGRVVVTAVGTGETTVTLGVGSIGSSPAVTVEVPVTIEGPVTIKQLTKDMFTVDTSGEPYTGLPKSKKITGTDEGAALVEGRDYTVTYANNINAGTAVITITGKGRYTGVLTYNFSIITQAKRAFSVSMEPAQLRAGGPSGKIILTDNAAADQPKYTYTSSNTAVATVSDGVVTPVGAGKTTITVSALPTEHFGGAMDGINLTVGAATPNASGSPGAANTPGTPEVTGTSGTTGTTDAPDAPSTPGAPAAPSVPGAPGVPDTPAAPSTPATPAAPVTNVVLSPQKLAVDGRNVDCEKYNIDGRNYFKLRDLASLLDGTGSRFDVGFDEATATVSITTGEAYKQPNGMELVTGVDNSATAQPSSQAILIDGEKYDELTAYNIGGSNFFQLRELGSVLGFEVDFDETTNTAIVSSAHK